MGVTGGANDDIGGTLPNVGGDIQQAFRGLGALPFHEDFPEGSFGAFQLWFKLYLYYS